MLAIPLMGYLALRSPSVQTYLAGKVTRYLSRELGAEITVGGVDISGFLDVVLEDIYIKDQQENSLLRSKRAVFDLDKISFRKRSMVVSKIVFDATDIYFLKAEGDSVFNFQFLTDYFARGTRQPDPDKDNWDVIVRSFEFRNSNFQINNANLSQRETGFDPNHFTIGNLNIDVKDIFLEDGTLQAKLAHLTLEEKDGFILENLSSEIVISSEGATMSGLRIKTAGTSMGLNLELIYDGYGAFASFIDDVSFQVQINPSVVDLYEFSYFLPDLYGMEGKADISGNFSGRVSNLRGNEIQISYGSITRFAGNFHLIGLPDINETFMNIRADRIVTHKADIESFKLPHKLNRSRITLPPETSRLGITSFAGSFTGFVYDFVAFGQFTSAPGNVSTNIAIVSDHDFRKISYTGKVRTTGFDIGRITGNTSTFGKIAMSSDVRGSGFDLKTLNMRITGDISLLQLKDYDYRNIKVSGNFINKVFNGNVNMADPNLYFDFGGIVDLREKLPLWNFTAHIDNANLSRLNIYQRDSLYDSFVSTIINVNARGNEITNLEGQINAYSTTYHEVSSVDTLALQHNYIRKDLIGIENFSRGNGNKQLRFYSDFLDVSMEGEINFEKLPAAFNKILYHHAPARFQNLASVASENGALRQKAEIEVMFKNTAEITSVFFPFVSIAPQSFFSGHINTNENEFALQGSTSFLTLNQQRLERPEISIVADGSHLEIVARGENLYLTDSVRMEQFFASAKITKDTLNLLTQWENRSSVVRNLGSIKARGQFISPARTELAIVSSYAYINDSLWLISPNNSIILDSSAVMVKNFRLFKNDEYLLVDGTLSDDPADVFNIKLNNFNIESLAFLLGDRMIDFSGIASGELQLSNLKQTPNVLTELMVKNFAFNRDHLGDLSLKSFWDSPAKAFKLEAQVIYHGNHGSNIPIIASGYFYPDRSDDNFDLDIILENLKMSIFSRYVSDFASNFRGQASGRLRLEGPLAAPELSGRARLTRTGFRVDYLNTVYSFAHEVIIEKDAFRFENLMLNDTLGNSARSTGVIRHRNFFDFEVDITMLPERLAVLNTQPYHNEIFYGKGFATGILHIHGPVDDIVIDIAATANRGTQIFLPLDYDVEVSESSFITFVHPGGEIIRSISRQSPSTYGMTLNFDLTVTPEAEVQIIFDSQIGDIMRGRGFGDLKIEIDNQGFFNMYGDYTIQEGDYLFTLQNLINKRFRIEQGGTIRWTGDPYDADIDIRALYRLRTSLFDLAASQSDTSEVIRRRVPVETVLHLTDKLFNPTINFAIQLPGSDESTREMIDRIITTEQEMNRQVFSLLILNRFVPPEDGFNNALSYGVGSTSTELLSNQLSNWLSQISSEFDIGINYRPGDEITAQEVELALSTQLFDDRVVIDGNLGVAGNHPAQTRRTSNIIGDVNVEVKITPEGKFRVKAFNRSNTFDILNSNAPYTQGVGVFYRREFDNFSDLFRRTRRSVHEIPEVEDMETNLTE